MSSTIKLPDISFFNYVTPIVYYKAVGFIHNSYNSKKYNQYKQSGISWLVRETGDNRKATIYAISDIIEIENYISQSCSNKCKISIIYKIYYKNCYNKLLNTAHSVINEHLNYRYNNTNGYKTFIKDNY